MQFDKSSNGPEMVSLVRGIRDYIVELSHGGNTYECVPVQGSATYGIEPCSKPSPDKSKARVLVIENGYYGLRLREVLSEIGIDIVRLELPVIPPASGLVVAAALDANPGITHLALCHCDTGTGILNPLEGIAVVCRERGVKLVVDAIASYAGFEINAPALDVEAVVISPNKCFEAVPGIALVLVKRESLIASKGWSPSSVLDLYAQWAWLEEKGFFPHDATYPCPARTCQGGGIAQGRRRHSRPSGPLPTQLWPV